jgi:antitoxin VapB
VAIYVKDRETETAVRNYAARKGLTVTAAIRRAVVEAEAVDEAAVEARYLRMLRNIRKIQARTASLPVLDDRTPDEILGYDENGLPT